MDHMLNRLVRAAIMAAIVVGCSKIALAVPTCPPLCLLPPDPAPPMPPINFPDPPFNPVAPQNPNNGNGNKGATSTLTMRKAGGSNRVTVTGTPQAGGECKAGSVSGTLVPQGGGKYMCNFTPSTLPPGAACHAMSKVGTVTVVDGKRYCKIAP